MMKTSTDYGIYYSEWELNSCKIQHFIRDRFGDQEGIFFEIQQTQKED